MSKFGFHQASWGKLTAAVCLTAYFLGGAGILPAFVAFTARMDGAHRVTHIVEEGRTQVILHHATAGEAGPRQQVTHHHGVACAVLCTFWADSGQETDHVLGIRSCGVSEKASSEQIQFAVQNGNKGKAAPLSSSAPILSDRRNAALFNGLIPPKQAHAPSTSGTLLQLSSIVLLL